jgi:hypothetical protein
MLQRSWQLFTGMRNARRQSLRLAAGVAFGLACILVQGAAHARSVLLVHSDIPSFATGAQSKLLATGLFTNVDLFDMSSVTPTLSALTPYDAVLAWTNFPAGNGAALGDVLADYVDSGHGLVLATYGYSGGFAIGGRITTPGYAPLRNVGVTGDVSGSLNVLAPADPIFAGVNTGSLTYFHNINFAHPGLDAGATLLADDGSGINMIARNANGSILGNNLFPGDITGNNAELYKLIGNELSNVPSTPRTSPVPEPASLALLGLGGLPLLRRLRPRRTA